MLRGEGMLHRKTVKNNNRSNEQKQLCACSTLFCTFLCRFFFCTTTTWNFQKLLSYTFYGWNVVSVPVHFFSLPHIFTLLWWPLQNFYVVLPTKICLLCFLSLGLRNNFRFPFSSLLNVLLSLLYKTPVAIRFPAKISSSCIWVAIPVDRVILPCACGADRRSLGVRSCDYQIFSDGYITSFSYPWCSPGVLRDRICSIRSKIDLECNANSLYLGLSCTCIPWTA